MQKQSVFILSVYLVLLQLALLFVSPETAVSASKLLTVPPKSQIDGGRRIALLMGINNYPAVDMLKGAVNDAVALRDVLVGRYGFRLEDTVLLADAQATKGNIMAELRRLKDRSSPGDQIFIFFSGHGTSSYDTAARLQIGDNTGALVPFDFAMDPKSSQKTLDSLIIGRRDLRPIFEELDKDRQVMVVADACYSGNAVRSLNNRPRGIPKYVTLPAFDDGYTPTISANVNTAKEELYPYRSLLYISAANDREKAMDLPFDSFDGKPHGALTGALLRGMRGDADLNNDGMVSYEELYQFSKRETQKEGHTPQLLRDSSIDITRRIFNAAPKLTKQTSNLFSGTKELRLKLEGGSASLYSELPDKGRLAITTAPDYDLLIALDGDEYLFAQANGDLLCRVRGDLEVKKRVERYLKIKELVSLTNPASSFNAWLTVGKDEGKSVFYEGENVSFQVRSEQDATILLLDIDPQGYLSVIWPETIASDNRVKKGDMRDLGINVPVSPPLGVEYLKLFAFKKPVSGLKKFAGRSPVDPASEEFAELEKLIRENTRPGGDWSEATVEVVSMKR